MRIYLLITFVLSVICSGQTPQNTPEYWQKEVEKTTDLFRSSDFEACLKICKKILSSKEKKLPETDELAMKNTYRSYIGLAEIDSAQIFLNKGIALAKANHSEKFLADCYFNQSLVYQYKADFTKQAEFSLKSIAVCKKIKLMPLLEQNYRNMTMLYLDQQDYNKALWFSKKSVACALELKNDRILSMAYGALGETYSMMYRDAEANQYFAKSYEISEKIQYTIGSAWTLTNWANVKKGDDALKTREKAQEIWNKISPDNIMSMNNLGQIGKIYFEKANHPATEAKLKKQYLLKSQDYLNQAIEKSKLSDNMTNLIESQKILAQVFAALGNYPKAYQTEKEYHQLSDSLYSQENKNKIAELENREKLIKKDREIAVKKLIIDQKEKQKWYLFGGIFLLLCIGLLLLYQNQIRRKNNQKLQALNQELDQANKVKTRFFSILNHDLRSPVSNLIDFLHLQKNSPDLLDSETRERLSETTLESAENLLHSMEDLLLWSKGQMEHFKPDFKTVAVEKIFQDTALYFSSEKIKIKFENASQLVLTTDENYLKTIVRNLTANALKALSQTPNPTIVWKAFTQNNQIFLSITDNGPGADQQQLKALYDESEIVGVKSGLGLHLIRDLARAIGCSVKVASEKNAGSTFTLTFNELL